MKLLIRKVWINRTQSVYELCEWTGTDHVIIERNDDLGLLMHYASGMIGTQVVELRMAGFDSAPPSLDALRDARLARPA